MLRIIVLGSCLLLFGCTSVRYALAPKKEPTIVEHFGTQDAAQDFLAPFISASVDVISGISPEQIERARETGEHIQIGEESSIASGTIVSGGEIVLTAAHVIRHGEPIVLVGRGSDYGSITSASLLWCSRSADLAALRPTRALPHSIEWIDRLTAGETVFLIGVFGQHSVGQVEEVDELSSEVLVIKHSAPIRGGDSGGPLVTESGDLAAINTGIEFGAIRYLYSEGRKVGHTVEGNDCFSPES